MAAVLSNFTRAENGETGTITVSGCDPGDVISIYGSAWTGSAWEHDIQQQSLGYRTGPGVISLDFTVNGRHWETYPVIAIGVDWGNGIDIPGLGPLPEIPGPEPEPFPAVLAGENTELYFQAVQGSDPDPNTFTEIIANPGETALYWTASLGDWNPEIEEGEEWLALDSEGPGIVDIDEQGIRTLTFDTGALPVGSYSVVLTIQDAAAKLSPRTITIYLEVVAASLAIPVAPTLLGFTRDGLTGTATVSGVAVGTTCEIWAIPVVNNNERVLLGSAAGTGAEQVIDLDLSDFYGSFLGLTAMTPCIIEAVAKNADGAYGPTSAVVLPIFINPESENDFTMILERDGTIITVTVSEVDATDQVIVAYTKADGAFGMKSRTGPGTLTFTDMPTAECVDLVGLRQDSLGSWIGSSSVGEEPVLYPSIVPRHKPEIVRK